MDRRGLSYEKFRHDLSDFFAQGQRHDAVVVLGACACMSRVLWF